MSKYILLKGCCESNYGQRFFTSNMPDKDQTRGNTGHVWYEVIGYADTVEEAQKALYGHTFGRATR